MSSFLNPYFLEVTLGRKSDRNFEWFQMVSEKMALAPIGAPKCQDGGPYQPPRGIVPSEMYQTLTHLVETCGVPDGVQNGPCYRIPRVEGIEEFARRIRSGPKLNQFQRHPVPSSFQTIQHPKRTKHGRNMEVGPSLSLVQLSFVSFRQLLRISR